jgi:hypothetical protein
VLLNEAQGLDSIVSNTDPMADPFQGVANSE